MVAQEEREEEEKSGEPMSLQSSSSSLASFHSIISSRSSNRKCGGNRALNTGGTQIRTERAECEQAGAESQLDERSLHSHVEPCFL